MFLQNNWYVAGFDHEINRTPLRRQLLDEWLVLYRLEDGTPVGLKDQCPHRFLPLSRGKLVGDEIQCGYHGLTFDRTGQCTRVPTQEHVHKSVCVDHYALAEKYGMVWLWYGDPSAADEGLIPNWDIGPGLDHHTSDAWASAKGYFAPKAHYSLVIDNLLDLSHIVYVHTSSFGSEDTNRAEMRSDVSETAISDYRFVPNGLPGPAFYGYVGDEKTPVDFWIDMHWQAPSNLLLEFGVTPPGRPRSEGFQWIASHLLTPINAVSTHYFWVVSRCFDLENEEHTQQWWHAVDGAFHEDHEVLEAQQKELGERQLLKDVKPLVFASDVSAMKARRIVQYLLEHQQGTT